MKRRGKDEGKERKEGEGKVFLHFSLHIG